MAKVYNGKEILTKVSTPDQGARTLQTTDRRICDSKDPRNLITSR